MIVAHSVFLRVRNIPDKSCTENQNTHFVFNKLFFENRVVCEIVWKNFVEPDRPPMKIWRMGNACWIPKAINTHSEYVILIAFPLQQWLHKGASVLRYITYITCLVKVTK